MSEGHLSQNGASDEVVDALKDRPSDELKYRPGDVLGKRKGREVTQNLIVRPIRKGDSYDYHIVRYKYELLKGHMGSTELGAEYFEELVEYSDDPNEWIDMDMGRFRYCGNVNGDNSLGEVKVRQFPHTPYHYRIGMGRMNSILSNNGANIESGWKFYETASGRNGLSVEEVGWKTGATLANDMIRLSYAHENLSFVDHRSNVLEAVSRGIWVPVLRK